VYQTVFKFKYIFSKGHPLMTSFFIHQESDIEITTARTGSWCRRRRRTSSAPCRAASRSSPPPPSTKSRSPRSSEDYHLRNASTHHFLVEFWEGRFWFFNLILGPPCRIVAFIFIGKFDSTYTCRNLEEN